MTTTTPDPTEAIVTELAEALAEAFPLYDRDTHRNVARTAAQNMLRKSARHIGMSDFQWGGRHAFEARSFIPLRNGDIERLQADLGYAWQDYGKPSGICSRTDRVTGETVTVWCCRA